MTAKLDAATQWGRVHIEFPTGMSTDERISALHHICDLLDRQRRQPKIEIPARKDTRM